MISSGRLEFISSAGTISGGTVISGGKIIVSIGGLVAGGLTLSGGYAVLSGVVGSGQTILFAGSGGVLSLYDVSAFSAVIGGFAKGDSLDLGGFAFTGHETRGFAEAPSGTSGTLTVTSGTYQANLVLLGSYATGNFTLADDGTGGTFVRHT